MNFLSIDCSTDTGSLFAKTQNKSFSKVLQSDKFKNDLLMKGILDFFMENNLKFDDLSIIFVNQGPGNFSSLRSSIAVAKGISLSKNLKLIGYDTFIWSCAKYFNKKDFIFSLIEFRGKYFIKKFEKKLISNKKIEEITQNEIIKKYEKRLKIIPKNMEKHFSNKILELHSVNVTELDHNDLEFLELKGLLEKDLIKPLYLS